MIVFHEQVSSGGYDHLLMNPFGLLALFPSLLPWETGSERKSLEKLHRAWPRTGQGRAETKHTEAILAVLLAEEM